MQIVLTLITHISNAIYLRWALVRTIGMITTVSFQMGAGEQKQDGKDMHMHILIH
jgi:hypothetical protein